MNRYSIYEFTCQTKPIQFLRLGRRLKAKYDVLFSIPSSKNGETNIKNVKLLGLHHTGFKKSNAVLVKKWF